MVSAAWTDATAAAGLPCLPTTRHRPACPEPRSTFAPNAAAVGDWPGPSRPAFMRAKPRGVSQVVQGPDQALYTVAAGEASEQREALRLV